jgi:hypothetical protein
MGIAIPPWDPYESLEQEAATAKPKRAYELLQALADALRALREPGTGMFFGKLSAVGDDERYRPRGLEVATRLSARIAKGKPDWAHACFDELEELEHLRGPSGLPFEMLRARLKPPPDRLPEVSPFDEQVLALVEKLRSLAKKWPQTVVIEPSLETATIARARGQNAFWPKGLEAMLRACGGFEIKRSRRGEPGVSLGLPMLTYAEVCGDARPTTRLPKSDAKLLRHPARLQVFQTGNGDALSYVLAPDGRELWIEDWSDGPTAMTEASLPDVLAWALTAERFSARGDWTAQWSDFFGNGT